jgi:Patatin-like phospholipase
MRAMLTPIPNKGSGFSMLVILEALMHRSFVEVNGRPPRPDEKPKPCDYFDLIAGTGTGGLIALMLGRLRLDLETCKNVYVRMTRKVFETDKTIAGIPYKHTLFKASKLEEAIRECVREHTVYEDEGNDGTATGGHEFQSMSPTTPQRAGSVRSNASFAPDSFVLNSPVSLRTSIHGAKQWGNPNASLYDGRENRTKTQVLSSTTRNRC